MNTKVADLGSPPPRPSPRSLGEPPQPIHAKNNIKKPEMIQLNVRLDPDKHLEIRHAALDEHMSLQDYVVFLHDQYMQRKTKKRA